MNYPLQALLSMGVVPTVQFPTDSRYYGTQTLSYTAPNGQTIAYLSRRIIPQPGLPNYAPVAQYTVQQGDRLDLIAARFLGDPLMFWLLCDANGAQRPDDLTGVPGTTITITLPNGTPGAGSTSA